LLRKQRVTLRKKVVTLRKKVLNSAKISLKAPKTALCTKKYPPPMGCCQKINIFVMVPYVPVMAAVARGFGQTVAAKVDRCNPGYISFTLMRNFKAIILVVLVLYNWVQGCLFCFEYTHRWELRHEMNQEEAALAARLQAQLLQQSAVRIVDQTYKGRLGVTDPYDFAFANAAAAGDTTWYVVHSQLPEATRQAVRLKDGNGSDPYAPLPPVSFQDFFSPYLPDQAAPLPVGRASQSGYSSLYPAPLQLSSRLLVADTPPPEV
jgi:hypothetical protein